MSDANDEDVRVPIEKALYGLSLHRLPPGWTPVAAIVLVKCIDEDGQPTWAFRTTDGVNEEETLGALTVQIDLLRRELLDAYTDDDT